MNNLIVRYLNGESTPEEKQQILAWLKEDQMNKKTFTEMRDIWLASASSATSDKEIQNAFSRFRQNIYSQEQKEINQRRHFFLRIAASIALLFVCTLGGYFIGKKNATTSSTKDLLVMNQVVMGSESKGAITLPDGTTVWLNANSKISYPETFSKDLRRVKLEGEAYFDVVQDTQSPFIVVADQMEVNVLGTTFDVKNYANQPYSETTLLTGKVKVRFSPNNEFTTLGPNQMISFDKQSNLFTIHQVEAKDYIIWTNDKLIFTNELLSDILYKMKKWYNIEITYANNVSLDQRLSLTIRREPKEEIFKLLGLIAPIKSTINGYNVYIQAK